MDGTTRTSISPACCKCVGCSHDLFVKVCRAPDLARNKGGSRDANEESDEVQPGDRRYCAGETGRYRRDEENADHYHSGPVEIAQGAADCAHDQASAQCNLCQKI
jgi:hypothetical protein